MIKKYFNNLVFPTKVNMSSQDITKKFKNTKHTINPTFINIDINRSLHENFLKVQNFMLL